jgi:flagellar basal-body rod modification protein FlgD
MDISSSLTGSTFTAQQGRDQFLTLLVTQLRHQDPFEPVKQEEFMQQLAQLSTLEGIEKLNARFEDLLRLEQLTEGANLVGRSVIYGDPSGPELHTGPVDSVFVENQQLYVMTSGSQIPIDQVRGIVS